jgi:3-demethylubiquinone-9 3-methyltransferase
MSISKPLITPCLWFDSEGEEAARFYANIFPNSEILHISHYTEVSYLIWLWLAMELLIPLTGSCLGDPACLAALN